MVGLRPLRRGDPRERLSDHFQHLGGHVVGARHPLQVVGGRLGDFGEKLVNCTLPAGRLPLNSRGEAWLLYVDQLQSPTQGDCAQIGFPAVLGEVFFLTAYPGRLVMEHPSNPWHLTRTVWMNGTGPQPLPGELFQHGLSRGHFDGDDLIIETDHFTFDPDGIDDHLHMASSVRKKITELRVRLPERP